MKSSIALLGKAGRFSAKHTEMLCGELLSNKPPYIRMVASGAMIRVPNLTAGIIRLLDASLPIEALALVRTTAELAITVLWMGRDEDRAKMIHNWYESDLAKGIKRASDHDPLFTVFEPVADALTKPLGERRRLPFDQMTSKAVDSPAIPARQMAASLYNILYDYLSAASHGDLRFAKEIAKGMDSRLKRGAITYASTATHFLMCGASYSLDILNEWDSFAR